MESKLFKTYIKGLRYREPGVCSVYISLYNEKGQRFYGTWIDDEEIEDYFEYEIEKVEKQDCIRRVWLKGYTDGLGIRSMNRKKNHLI